MSFGALLLVRQSLCIHLVTQHTSFGSQLPDHKLKLFPKDKEMKDERVGSGQTNSPISTNTLTYVGTNARLAPKNSQPGSRHPRISLAGPKKLPAGSPTTLDTSGQGESGPDSFRPGLRGPQSKHRGPNASRRWLDPPRLALQGPRRIPAGA